MEALEETEFKSFKSELRFLDELLRLSELRLERLEIRVSQLETHTRSS